MYSKTSKHKTMVNPQHHTPLIRAVHLRLRLVRFAFQVVEHLVLQLKLLHADSSSSSSSSSSSTINQYDK